MPIRKPANKSRKEKSHNEKSSINLYAFELGRIKNLSIAELENVLGQENLIELIGNFAIFNLDEFIQNDQSQLTEIQRIQKLQNKLGGTIKIAKVVETISLGSPSPNNSSPAHQSQNNPLQNKSSSPDKSQETFVSTIESALEQLLTSHFKDHSGKIPFAISLVNIPGNSKIFLKNSLNFSKKILKFMGFNSRFINKPWVNAEPAQIYRSWTVEKGIDITIIGGNVQKEPLEKKNILKNSREENAKEEGKSSRKDQKIYITKTISIQDINSYSIRDYDKPFRDPHMGMLPPKLAQIMLNLATDSQIANHSKTIFDPFCGSGTILAEALLQGKEAIGSDIDKIAVDGTIKNLNWLVENFFDKSANTSDKPEPPAPNTEKSQNQVSTAKKPNHPNFKIFQKNSVLLTKEDFPKNLDAIVSETYLGLPASKIIPPNERVKRFEEIAFLHKNWLSNLKKILQPKELKNLKIVIALPALKIGPRNYNYFPNPKEFFKNLGFEVQNKKTLIYDREDQFVAREIVILAGKQK